jgi:putative FmdB family regulatory protein
MPTYEYRCASCGHEFERFQPITENPVAECPRCKGKPERLISGGAGLLFKGTGFYITDHRSREYLDKAKKDKPVEKSSSSDSSSKASPGSSKSTPESKPGSKAN